MNRRIAARGLGLGALVVIGACRPEAAFGVTGLPVTGAQETIDGIAYAWDRNAIEIAAGDRSLDMYPMGCDRAPVDCLRQPMGLCTLRVEKRFFFDPDCTGAAQTVSDVEARLNNDRPPSAAEQREYRRHRRELRVEAAYWTWLLHFAPRRSRPDSVPTLERGRGSSGLLLREDDDAGRPERYVERHAANRVTYERERLVVESIDAGAPILASGFKVELTRAGSCYTKVMDAETAACDPEHVEGLAREDFTAVWHGLAMADAFVVWNQLFEGPAPRPAALGGRTGE